MNSLHFSPPFVARRFKGAAWLAFVTEERAGIVDTMLERCRKYILRHSGEPDLA